MYSNQGPARAALWKEPCLAAKTRRLHRMLVGVYDDALRPHGLTVAQLDLMMTVLTARDAMRPIDVARALRMDRSTVTRNVQRLTVRGFVAVAPGANGRESVLSVTSLGREAAEAAADAWFEAQQVTRARIGKDGLGALDLLIQRLQERNQEDEIDGDV